MRLARLNPWTWATLGVLTAVVSVHLRFVLRDARAPRDLGLYYAALPGLYRALEGGDVLPPAQSLTVPGGLYNVLLAVWLWLAGLSAVSFRLVDVFWVGLIVWAGARVARHASGPPAGAIAAAFLGAAPAVVMQGRLSWIHIPEAALVLLATWAWMADHRLRGRLALAGVALAGGLALSLRPSALAWLGLLGLAMLWRERPSARRLAWVGLAWGLGALPWLVGLPGYFQAKAGARSTYTQVLPSLASQYMELTGHLGTILGVLGLGLAVGLPDRGDRRLLWAWALLPVFLFVLFRAGVDNHTVGLVALLLVAAVGWARLPRVGLGLALMVFVATWVPQWTGGVDSVWGRRLGLPGRAMLVGVGLPYTAWGVHDVLALVDATCPDRPCRVAVDQGLFQPYGESPGQLGLFLSGRSDVTLLDLRDGDDPGACDALMHYDCGDRDRTWRIRFPRSLETVLETIASHGLAPAWSRPIEPPCRPLWFTPGGAVADPTRLPAGNDAVQGVVPRPGRSVAP